MRVPTSQDFRALRLAVSTAIQLPEAVARRFFERFGRPLTEAYGIIEVGLPFIHTPAAGAYDGRLGRPLPAYEIRLADGEVLIRGPGLFLEKRSSGQGYCPTSPEPGFFRLSCVAAVLASRASETNSAR